ncbi:MAG: putative molybdenum carrier protein [Puia sp.]|nr:putative molybdenum carrier protein [Puia sp.]
MKIITGGQTGIDRYALEIARDLGFETGGTAARNFMTEIGPDPSLALLGLIENDSLDYPVRTLKNVLDADGTLLLGNVSSSGSSLTRRLCRDHGKPILINPGIPQFLVFIRFYRIETLHVAGNRESRLNLEDAVKYHNWLRAAFQAL